MSIENNLKRIADALENLVTQQEPMVEGFVKAVLSSGDASRPLTEAEVVAAQEKDEAKTVAEQHKGDMFRATEPAPTEEPKNKAAPPPPAKTEAAPPPKAKGKAQKKAPAMTMQELNGQLGVEFKRLGGREKIDEEIAKLGTSSSLTDLPEDKYAELLTNIQALEGGK